MNQSLKATAKGVVSNLVMARAHAVKRANARRALRALIASGRQVSAASKRQTLEYATEHLGWRGYAEWLDVYTAVNGEFKPGWLPDNYYFAHVMPKISGGYHHTAKLRGLNHSLFADPAFPDLAYLANGLFFDRNYRPINRSDLVSYLQQHSDSIVFKVDDTAWGSGIHFSKTRDLNVGQLAAMGNGVIQTRIRPHEFFDQFQLPSLPTLRVVTVIGNCGTPSLRASYIKFGRKGHGHVKATDQIRIAVDCHSGRMSHEGFLTSWKIVTSHPDTGIEFSGLRLPLIDECFQTALRLHARMPMARFICWDMVPDHNEQIQVMEWEGGVIPFAEATQGPCFTGLGWDRLHLNSNVTPNEPTLIPDGSMT